jgi:3-phenylpropionate/trans-cinnamate dioxygenase ferredoxin subunit
VQTPSAKEPRSTESPQQAASGTVESGALAGYERVAALDEIPPGSLRAVRTGGLALALCNVEGEIYAVEDNCSHQHFPLSQGELDEEVLTCEWHGARFDVRTGEALSLPAVRPVRTFAVKVEGGDVYVRTEGEPPTPPEALIQRDTR